MSFMILFFVFLLVVFGRFVLCCFFDSFDKIADFVKNNASDGDMIITMGAGDIYKVGEMILENK